MASRALDDLRNEHQRMTKLLELLQHQVELVAEDREPDDALLLEIAEYFGTVPDLFHHPKEDLILRLLASVNPEAAETLKQLEVEHEEGGREFKRFTRAMVRLLLEPQSDRDRFLSAALAFMESERRHIAWEEKNFFEVAEAMLLPDHWGEIDVRLQCLIDPLRKRELQGRFERVERALAAWRSPDATGSAVRLGNAR
jgi:hemerythrin-like domain-containing protein